MKNILLIATLALLIVSCGEKEMPTTNAQINFQFQFDPTQERLDGKGELATIPSGHATQSPDFNSMSGYFIELVPDKFTNLRAGAVIYEATTQPSDDANFTEAVVFDEAVVRGEGVNFISLPIQDIPVGTYEYLRISVTYQNADVRFNLKNLPPPFPPNLDNQLGTLASFIGFNTHINDLKVKNQTIAVNDDKNQGFWAFEVQLDEPYQGYYLQYADDDAVSTGQSPSGGTTVVNPLEAFGVTLPFGSCIVTGALDEPLTITGNETEDINLTLSFSVNNSFEWIDDNGNGEWDFDVQANTVEQVVDMGLRGLKVLVE